jgi:SAM-dependent methyltransferase
VVDGGLKEGIMTDLKYSGLDHQPASGETQGRLIQALRRVARAQFGRPTGLLGSVAGFMMARTPSNLDRTRWTLSLLDVKPSDRMLEVGFGPGLAIEELSKIVTHGFIAGIDHSEEMVRQAGRRNAQAVRGGRIVLQRACASAPPAFDRPFDKIFTINSIHFWNEPVECLRKLRGLLRPGGLMAVTLQPRTHAATDETTAILGQEIAGKLERAGFSRCHLNIKKANPVAVACVLATN